MILPRPITDQLANNPELSSLVQGTLHVSSQILSTRPVFFPEYTDHSEQHFQDVLDSSLNIIPDRAKPLLSDADLATLIVSILLHDCGMHITEEGFQTLISAENKRVASPNDPPWSELWRDFLSEARRFDSRQLKRLFGSVEGVRVPPKDPDDYLKNDFLLIGEFLRRHHPRLAQEIAIFGFPARGGLYLPFVANGNRAIVEISGLIARSHGMPLRHAVDILKKSYHEREYQNIHATMIMSVLRVADFMQIQPERAPEIHSKLHRLKSPFSRGEWKVHQCVRNITTADQDPEAIYVDAYPEDIETFLKFSRWAKAFQGELDGTWAVLGEVYGRYVDEGFDQFGLKLRRIRTNLDDQSKFAELVEYVPAKISFEASGPDLLPLLVSPLYGNRPDIALRELIQNSVDSVLERTHHEKARPTETVSGHDVDVLVKPVFENGEISSIEVSDRGVGMTIEIVKDYFLQAGLSFRSSMSWRQDFTHDDGRSKIARAGRFGVGALSAFLIGPRIQVRTRRFDQETGYSFEADLETEAIDVRKVKCPIGTSISIPVLKKDRKRIVQLFKPSGGLLWDWYCNSFPSLLRLSREGKDLGQELEFTPDVSWTCVDSKLYQSVHWKHSTADLEKFDELFRRRRYDQYGLEVPKKKRGRSRIYCNGIFIQELRVGPVPRRDFERYGHSLISDGRLGQNTRINPPVVTIKDTEARFPLNLQRDTLIDFDPILSNELRESIAIDLCLEIIAKAPEISPFDAAFSARHLIQNDLSCLFESDQLGRDFRRFHWCWESGAWRIADHDFSLNSKYHLNIVDEGHTLNLECLEGCLSGVAVSWCALEPGKTLEVVDYIEALRRVLGKTGHNNERLFTGAILVSNELLAGIRRGMKMYDFLEDSNEMLKELEIDVTRLEDWSLISSAGFDHPLLDRLCSPDMLNPQSHVNFILTQTDKLPENSITGFLYEVWSSLVSGRAIPMRFSDRRDALPDVFEKFYDRIMYYKNKL